MTIFHCFLENCLDIISRIRKSPKCCFHNFCSKSLKNSKTTPICIHVEIQLQFPNTIFISSPNFTIFIVSLFFFWGGVCAWRGQRSNIRIQNPEEILTWNGIEHADISQTLKDLCTNRSRDPTSQMLMSPTLVPTIQEKVEITTNRNWKPRNGPFPTMGLTYKIFWYITILNRNMHINVQ